MIRSKKSQILSFCCLQKLAIQESKPNFLNLGRRCPSVPQSLMPNFSRTCFVNNAIRQTKHHSNFLERDGLLTSNHYFAHKFTFTFVHSSTWLKLSKTGRGIILKFIFLSMIFGTTCIRLYWNKKVGLEPNLG